MSEGVIPARSLPPYAKSACQCAGCGLVFGGLAGFDLHRNGPHDRPGRRCLSADELAAFTDKQGRPVLRLDGRGVWVRRAPQTPRIGPRGDGRRDDGRVREGGE